jgi:uncharacterized membrane protein YeaQ/YmgE (transglycosylase-associated protein family)
MLNIIGMIASGAIIGVLARFFYPGEVPLNLLYTILLGIGGSLLAGLVVGSRSGGMGGGVNRAGCFASVIGAIVLILVARMLGWL